MAEKKREMEAELEEQRQIKEKLLKELEEKKKNVNKESTTFGEAAEKELKKTTIQDGEHTEVQISEFKPETDADHLELKDEEKKKEK